MQKRLLKYQCNQRQNWPESSTPDQDPTKTKRSRIRPEPDPQHCRTVRYSDDHCGGGGFISGRPGGGGKGGRVDKKWDQHLSGPADKWGLSSCLIRPSIWARLFVYMSISSARPALPPSPPSLFRLEKPNTKSLKPVAKYIKKNIPPKKTPELFFILKKEEHKTSDILCC